jgi:hypothetical protein
MEELGAAGIAVVPEDRRHCEVPSEVSGTLGGFRFSREWYYWVCEGVVPAQVAQYLYDHPIGRADVRVNGYAGNRKPRGPVSCYHIDSQAGLNLFVETLQTFVQ